MNTSNLRPSGIIDAVVGSSLLAQVQSDLKLQVNTFRLDCSDISAINEQGLDYLLQALNLVKTTQGRFLLFSMNASTLSYLLAKELDRVLELYL